MNVVGMYCIYQNNKWLILRKTNDLVLIINGEDDKRQVKLENVTLRLDVMTAVEVTHQGTTYLVTPKFRIFSMLTYKRMSWPANNGNRVQIVESARSLLS
jgi:hypothetical protein